MATTRLFSAAIEQFGLKTMADVLTVRNESTERVVEAMQRHRNAGGRMRVKTGFLRASLMASTNMMPVIRESAKPAENGAYTWDGGSISLVIAGATLSDSIYLGYTASYAAHREYGARGQEPDAFVRTAAQQWQGIVASVAAEVRAS